MTCGMIYENEQGILAACILPDHEPWTGHCDGDDCYYEDDQIDGDPLGAVFYEAGIIDLHGIPVLS